MKVYAGDDRAEIGQNDIPLRTKDRSVKVYAGDDRAEIGQMIYLYGRRIGP